MTNKIIFSIIIVNFNDSRLLGGCLNSISKSTYKNFEVIIVDNGSNNKIRYSIKNFTKKYCYSLKIIFLNKNYGPAKARNIAVKKARGKYLGFLDNDTEVNKNWILKADEIFNKHPKVGSIQCKLLQLQKKTHFDYLGEYLSNFGFLVPLVPFNSLDNKKNQPLQKILAAKSAGMFIKKDLFQQIKGFDEKYFIFLEETDLGWRVWLHNYQVVTCPSSIVYHRFSSTKNIVSPDFNNYLIRFHGTKNYIYTLIKNLSPKLLLKILPVHIFLWFGFSFYLLLHGNIQSSLNIIRGIFWNLKYLPQILKQRHYVQSHRLISDQFIFYQNKLLVTKNLWFFISRFKKSQIDVTTPENQNVKKS